MNTRARLFASICSPALLRRNPNYRARRPVRKGRKDGGAHHELEGVHDVGSGAERQDILEERTVVATCSVEHGSARTATDSCQRI
jgi:hypothetical protein